MRYLVVVGQGGGMAQLTNVVVVDAETERAAKERACDLSSLIRESVRDCYAIELVLVPDGWSYFT